MPPAQRRRGDAGYDGLPPLLGDGYAILRPMHLDPQAHLPIVTLRAAARGDEPVPACRFALVGLLPRDASASVIVEGLGEIFADAQARAVLQAPPPDESSEARGRRGAGPVRPPGYSGRRPVDDSPFRGGCGARIEGANRCSIAARMRDEKCHATRSGSTVSPPPPMRMLLRAPNGGARTTGWETQTPTDGALQ